ncbi:MAG: sigma-54 dependent transcriptional regulator [Terriglobales bacterium]
MTSLPVPPNYANHVLVASPSTVVRERVLESLRSPARCFEQAAGGAEALVHLESGFWQVLFLDRQLPDLDAEELSHTVRRRFPEIEVVLLDGDAGAVADREKDMLAEAWPALRQADSREWSGQRDDERANSECGDHAPVRKAVSDSFSNCAAPLPGMVGNSLVMQPVYRLARLLAPRDTTVLITGPTGSGKEVVARAIHQLSPRSARGFAVVNCAAIPETMLEAELFGYARGAFTGSVQSYAGRIQAAQGGTLFLDEIGEMPLSLQPKLLRFLEQKEIQRLGSAELVRVDARVVSATNAHLLSLVREGKFREDLYYRLCGFPIEIPPLRDRPEDIGQLAAHFLAKCAWHLPAPELSAAALQLLKTQPWAGNIRELQNVIERALILSGEHTMILPEHLLFSDSSGGVLR